jgi:hypothetical protein
MNRALHVVSWNYHRFQRFGFESLRRTPWSYQYHPKGPVNGIPSAKHRGDSVDPEIPLNEFIAPTVHEVDDGLQLFPVVRTARKRALPLIM